jgi:hypothetical protein
LSNINGIRSDLYCRKIDLDCIISFSIFNFDLNADGKVNLKLYETESFCSAISMKIETTSSIPGEISSISNVIWSNKNQYFKGSVPSTFSYLMTPSLFKTDSSIWQTDTTGYHISIQKEPVYGSQAYVEE